MFKFTLGLLILNSVSAFAVTYVDFEENITSPGEDIEGSYPSSKATGKLVCRD